MKQTVIATPCLGVNMPLSSHSVELEATGAALADLVGEAVTAAIDNAYEEGVDVGDSDFSVSVIFRGGILQSAKRET